MASSTTRLTRSPSQLTRTGSRDRQLLDLTQDPHISALHALLTMPIAPEPAPTAPAGAARGSSAGAEASSGSMPGFTNAFAAALFAPPTPEKPDDQPSPAVSLSLQGALGFGNSPTNSTNTSTFNHSPMAWNLAGAATAGATPSRTPGHSSISEITRALVSLQAAHEKAHAEVAAAVSQDLPKQGGTAMSSVREVHGLLFAGPHAKEPTLVEPQLEAGIEEMMQAKEQLQVRTCILGSVCGCMFRGVCGYFRVCFCSVLCKYHH